MKSLRSQTHGLEEEAATTRFKSNHVVFEKLESFLTSISIPAAEWFAGAEQALTAIYMICESPDKFAEKIIKKMGSRLFSNFPG